MRFFLLWLAFIFTVACGSSGFDIAPKKVVAPSQSESPTSETVIASFSVPESVLSLTVPISDFSIEKKDGVSYYYLLSENISTPISSDSRWTESVPVDYTFSFEGDKTLYAWVKDSNGTLYASRSVSLSISLPDMTAPIVTTFSLPATIDGMDVPIQGLIATDDKDVTHYLITESPFKPSSNDSAWSENAPVVYIVSVVESAGAGQGGSSQAGTQKMLYAWAKDASGNISQSLSASVRISLTGPRIDTYPPGLYAFQIPVTTGGLNIPISSALGWDDIGITGYLVTESNVAPSPASASWSAMTPTSYSVASGGFKTIYLWAKDATGKISAPISATTYIYIDTVSDPLVLILIRDYLKADADVDHALASFLASLSARGYSNAEVQVVGKVNANTLRQTFISKRIATDRKFAGVFLIGDISQATYVHPNDFSGVTAVFPSDHVFTALDSTVTYNSVDGRFSNVTGDLKPKIWLGRVDFSRNSLYGNEIDTTISYLNKLANDESVHASSTLKGKSLVFAEKDWVNTYIVPTMPGFAVSAKNYPNLTQTAYIDAIKQNYEMMHVMVHSNPTRHYFSAFSLGASPGFLVETRLVNLFACSAVLPSSNSLLESYMLSGTKGGIVFIGSTKSGSMADGQAEFYTSIQNGRSIGEAFMSWQGDQLFLDYNKRWHLGMSLNGDPTVRAGF